MWSHLIQLMRARRALRAGRYDAVLGLLEDPLVREDRRAVDLRARVLGELCERAARRMETGQLDLARRDLDRVSRSDPEHSRGQGLIDELEGLRGKDREAREQRETLLGAFDRAFEEGRLGEAREILGQMNGFVDKDVKAELDRRLKERRKSASRQLAKVREELEIGLEGEARQSLERARRLCADSISFRERLVGLSTNWAQERWDEVQKHLQADRPLEAAQVLNDWWESDPESGNLSEARDLLLCVADKLAALVRRTAERGDFGAALVLASKAPGEVARVDSLRRLKELLDRLDLALNSQEEDPRRRVRILTRIEAETRWKALKKPLAALRTEAEEIDQELVRIKEKLSRGDLEEGRKDLDRLLDHAAGCEDARSLLEGLMQDEQERCQRLDAARGELREGRLLEARKLLFGLVGGGPGADEAKNLMRDVERIQAKVHRELRALEARFEAGESPDLLLPLLERLEKHQADSPEIRDLEGRLKQRRERESREQRILSALEHRNALPCLEALREWVAEGGEGKLRAEDRHALEALGREIQSRVREALRAGHANYVLDLGNGLRTWEDLLGLELAPLLDEATRRVDKARSLAQDGLLALEGKQVDQARQLEAQARELGPEEPTVLRLRHRLKSLDREKALVEEARDLAARDRDGARGKLMALGPTPRPLSSMVFDLKERLDRGGDLENGFLLQVEEAGEYLVLTEDRLRIGNATGKSYPQIPVLARIRGHHATLCRSVSFHGGIKDSIRAEEGCSLQLEGHEVREGDLNHGTHFKLGGVLPFLYQRPCPRSATALLRIERGFECKGTSRILWLKQGGKDGRIRIGRGREVHVRVPQAEPELYLYSPKPGVLRLFFDGPGQVDGRKFQGEIELGSGNHVQCGGISFRILPL